MIIYISSYTFQLRSFSWFGRVIAELWSIINITEPLYILNLWAFIKLYLKQQEETNLTDIWRTLSQTK